MKKERRLKATKDQIEEEQRKKREWYHAQTPEQKERAKRLRKENRLNRSQEQKEKDNKTRRRWLKEHPVRKIFLNIRARAGRRGLEFDLTEEWIKTRFEKGCEVTGRAFDYLVPGGRTIDTASIDRIDSTKGYTMDNCRMVVWGWNMACSTWGEKALLKMFEDRQEQEATP
jgi:hypothetical protein